MTRLAFVLSAEASYCVLRGERYTAYLTDAGAAQKIDLLNRNIRWFDLMGEIFVHDDDRDKA